MFHEVRIYNEKGNLKKVVSSRELSEAYWNAFNEMHPSKLESLILLREYKKQISSADHNAPSDARI